jgi:hypothetical protein
MVERKYCKNRDLYRELSNHDQGKEARVGSFKFFQNGSNFQMGLTCTGARREVREMNPR